MEALLQYGPTILLFIAVLAVLVLVHEFGHFITARFFGMDVEEFGVGFPPKVFGKKFGKTVYSINLIPLGGFVRIKGEDDPGNVGPGTFSEKSLGARALVVSAGVIMNLLLASVLFSIGFMIGLPQVADEVPQNARVRDYSIQVLELVPDFPAAEAGLQIGDAIISIDGTPFEGITHLQTFVDEKGGMEMSVLARRGSEEMTFMLTPRLNEETGKNIMGLALVETAVVSYPWYSALPKGIAATGFYVKEIFVAFFDLVKGLFVKEAAPVEFSGPVGIAVLTGRVAKLGFVYLLQFTALLSVNLAVINILPIPALDGGRLVFLLIERVRGRGVRPFVEAAIHRMAFILLLLLILIVTIQDIERYKGPIVNALKSIFGVS